MPALKDQILEKLERLPESDLNRVWDFLQYLAWRKIRPDLDRGEPHVSNGEDPLVGLFEGPSDLATRAEEILQQSSVDHSGWTWKRE
jgi:hypothetical protein